MKHVTIDPSLANALDSQNVAANSTPSEGTPRLLTPKGHGPLPGVEEGYRTPIGEDFELQNGVNRNSSSRERTSAVLQSGNGNNNSSSHQNWHHSGGPLWLRVPPPAAVEGAASLGHSANTSVVSFGERLFEKLQWRERIRHYTWTFFTMTMATGGIANVLYEVPFRFNGLYAIGLVFFLLNIVLFLFNVLMISLRFYNHPEMFKASILHPTERLFVPAAVVSFGTILLNISQYGPSHAGHWLNDAVAVLYWIDAGLAFLASMGIYLIMWSTASFTISQMTPIWIFPAYPLLIIGPHAGVLSQTVAQHHALRIIVGGFTLQGIGFLVSLMIYSAFLYRLMTQKLPQEATRPGMFVSVGPSAFTVAGVIGMAEGAQRALPVDFMGDGNVAKMILKVIASWMSLWIWGLAFWFFFISAFAHWSCIQHGTMTFTMTWFSYVFPNTALVTATFAIGRAFDSRTIQIVGCVMTPILIGIWFFVFGMMIRAVYLKQILWPQKGEDKDEGGFKEPRKRSRTLSA